MKKLLAALGIMGCLFGGTWVLYGAISGDTSSSSGADSSESTELKPYDTDSLAVSSTSESPDEPREAQRETSDDTAEKPRRAESASEREPSESSSEQVETETVVLNVERDDPDESPSSENKGSSHSNEPDEEQNEDRYNFPPPEPKGVPNGNMPELDKQTREALIRSVNERNTELQTLPDNIQEMPSVNANALPGGNQ